MAARLGAVADLDFETRSAVDLKTQGAYRYAVDPSTAILNFYWRLEGVGEGLWMPGLPLPAPLLAHIAAGSIVGAHNAVFERLIWNCVLRRLHPEAPRLEIRQMTCTLARAAAHGLPQGLDQLGEALKLRQRKDMDGHHVMRRLSTPKAYTPEGAPVFVERWEDPEAYAKLDAYVKQDVVVEAEADRILPELTERERRVWELDQLINDRGVPVDMESVWKCREAVNIALAREGRRLWEITGGKVTSVSQHARIAEWITSRGVPCTSVAADVVEDLLPVVSALGFEDVEEVLEIRAESGKASVRKLDAMLRVANEDGRCRGQLQYHGAGPGRWAGRLVQFQNVVRIDPDRDGTDIDLFVALVEASRSPQELHDALVQAFGGVVRIASKGLRGQVRAKPGKKLIGGDYSNIEGRIGAWLGGETWKLDAFRAYDEGTGPDLYKLAVSKSFGTPVEEVDKTERQLGKVQELALGFQGGVKAFLSMAQVYRVKLGAIEAVVQERIAGDIWDQAWDRFEPRYSFGLPRGLWTALKSLVMAWRLAHPGITKGWWEMQDAAVAAVSQPGTVEACAGGRVRYVCANGFLWCSLPSKRVLAYAYPQIVINETRRPLPSFEHVLEEDLDDSNSELIREQRQVGFWGVDSKTRRWGRKRLYGGLQWENVVQATARDVMVEGMFKVEAAGYPLVLTVHDELLSEVDEDFGSVEEFRSLMSELPGFVDGLPLSAAAWTDQRYVK